MGIFIFIVVIVALVLVHEFGHLIAAKATGMRVDEFGIGYPPRLGGFKAGETLYSINALPFGGFVKIYGEDPPPVGVGQVADVRAFASRPRILQALVLVAGIAMNFLFAYGLFVGGLYAGTPRALAPSEISQAKDAALAVAQVLPGSPAANADLEPADTIRAMKDSNGASWSAADPKSFTDFVAGDGGRPLILSVERNGQALTLTATPEKGIVESHPERYALGVAIATIGSVPLPLGSSIVEGATLTWAVTLETAQALLHFFAGVFTFSADLSQVAGPVGIAKAVGSASASGLGNLLSLTALISINLALINLIPIPALDGGRLLFVAIEAVIRRPIKARVAQTVNATGFAFLILLMVIVTAHDVFKLIG